MSDYARHCGRGGDGRGFSPFSPVSGPAEAERCQAGHVSSCPTRALPAPEWSILGSSDPKYRPTTAQKSRPQTPRRTRDAGTQNSGPGTPRKAYPLSRAAEAQNRACVRADHLRAFCLKFIDLLESTVRVDIIPFSVPSARCPLRVHWVSIWRFLGLSKGRTRIKLLCEARGRIKTL